MTKTPQQKISEAIIRLVESWGTHPYMINCGSCDTFAYEIGQQFPEAESFWGDEIPEEFPKKLHVEDASGHCFIKFLDKYYDAEEPAGVSKPEHLPLYQRIMLELKEQTP